MANNQEQQILTAREYSEILEYLDKEILSLVKAVGRKLGTVWTKLKNRFKDKTWAFVTDILDSFLVDTSARFEEMAAIAGGDLARSLYGVQQDLYSLKVALIQAAAPLAQALIPLLRQAIGLLTGFAQSIAAVLRSLFGGSDAAESYTGSVQAAVGATQALKRSLAGFDQLERLSSGNNSSSFFVPDVQEIAPQWQAFVKDILKLLEPLRQIDMGPAIEGFAKLKEALEPITKALFEGLNWAWHNLFVPIAQWAAENVLPAFLELLTQALQTLHEVILELKPGFTWLWENFLEPMAYWYADKILSDIKGMTEGFRDFGSWVKAASPLIGEFLTLMEHAGFTMHDLYGQSDRLNNMMLYMASTLDLFSFTARALDPDFAMLLAGINMLVPPVATLTDTWDILTNATNSARQAIENSWANVADWFSNKVTAPMQENAKTSANGMIGIFNGMLKGVSEVFNLLSRSVNSINFTIPDWVPVLGGKKLNFSLPGLNLPSIPLLAKGAVLPANKPFLAMVGDQKHGTNVEAPLATIQEAVLLALEDRLDGVMAGFNAVTQRQEQILQAIFTLDVSDGALAAAVQRHEDKMLAVTGGCI